VTLNVRNGQTITFKPGNGLYNGEDIHIVATGMPPGLMYTADECTAEGPFDAAHCDKGGFRAARGDASGTVTIDYTALKGPFGGKHITCGAPGSCELVIVGATTGNNDQQVIVGLDFA
jgi:hypothetical protein